MCIKRHKRHVPLLKKHRSQCEVQENDQCLSCYRSVTCGWFLFSSVFWVVGSRLWRMRLELWVQFLLCIIPCGNNVVMSFCIYLHVSPSLQIFIDRDPSLFAPILNFLRTKELHPRSINVHMLMHEAEFYGITPLGETQRVWVLGDMKTQTLETSCVRICALMW